MRELADSAWTEYERAERHRLRGFWRDDEANKPSPVRVICPKTGAVLREFTPPPRVRYVSVPVPPDDDELEDDLLEVTGDDWRHVSDFAADLADWYDEDVYD